MGNQQNITFKLHDIRYHFSLCTFIYTDCRRVVHLPFVALVVVVVLFGTLIGTCLVTRVVKVERIELINPSFSNINFLLPRPMNFSKNYRGAIGG